MIKYTKTAIDLVIKDLRFYYRIFRILSSAVMAGFFIYAIVTGLGNLVVNIILLSLLVVYLILDLIIDDRKARRYIRHGYHWIKLALRAFTLGTALYGVYEASQNITPFNIILLTLMIILWIIQFIFEILVIIFERKKDFVLEAIEKDVEEVKNIYRKPVNAVKGLIKNVFGNKDDVIEVEPEEDSKNIQRIKKHLEEQDK